jgi:hypothetical protein
MAAEWSSKEAQMSRAIAAIALVFGFTFTTAAIGQDSSVKTKTKIKGDDAQTVTYTGCVQTGTQPARSC